MAGHSLPTLRPYPRGHRRTARGRCGSLHLHRSGLSPPTPCRFHRRTYSVTFSSVLEQKRRRVRPRPALDEGANRKRICRLPGRARRPRAPKHPVALNALDTINAARMWKRAATSAAAGMVTIQARTILVATFHRTADTLRSAPRHNRPRDRMVVAHGDTEPRRREQCRRTARLRAKALHRVRRVIFEPIVLTMRHPP